MTEADRTVQAFMHNIAACIHFGMHRKAITKEELKELLVDWPNKNVLDDLLAANVNDRITVSHLADVGFMLGFKWDFKIQPVDRSVLEVAQMSDGAK